MDNLNEINTINENEKNISGENVPNQQLPDINNENSSSQFSDTASNQEDSVNTQYALVEQTNNEGIKKKSKKKIIIPIVIITFVVIIAALSAIILPKVLVSTEQLLIEKKYTEAYNRAKDEKEKQNILAENVAAYVCENIVISSLKNPDSFKLTEIRYLLDKPGSIVLGVSGTNGFGGASSSYWYISYNQKNGEFEYVSSVSSLEEEKYSKYDSSSESAEKIIDNLVRKIIIDNYTDKDSKIDKSAVKRINELFKNDQLDNIKLIEGIDFSLSSENK